MQTSKIKAEFFHIQIYLHFINSTMTCSNDEMATEDMKVAGVKSKQFSVVTDTVFVGSSAFDTLSSALSFLSGKNASFVTSNEGRRRETLGRPNSIKEHQKKTGKKGHSQSQQQKI